MGKARDSSGGEPGTNPRTPPIPRQAEAAMTVPYMYVEAGWFIGACLIAGAIVGGIIGALRRG